MNILLKVKQRFTFFFLLYHNRNESIAEAYDKLKKKQEEMTMINKDIIVLSMLMDGTLPDDMKQQG